MNCRVCNVVLVSADGGYTKNNVRLTTYHANIALNIFGLDAFMELCADTTRFQTAGVL